MTDLLFNIELHQGETTIIFRGELKIRQVEKLRDVLMESSHRSGNERVVLEDVSGMDIFSIQIIYLWKRLLAEQGRLSGIEWPVSKDLLALLRNAGITRIM